MKVILKRDVKGLGREGDLKDVKVGYGRNFLLPSGAAVIADKGAVANWERHRTSARSATAPPSRRPRRRPRSCATSSSRSRSRPGSAAGSSAP